MMIVAPKSPRPTVNIPATLIAFKLIRPTFMAKFRRDVMDYVLTAGTVGAVTLALLYVVAAVCQQHSA